MLRGLNNDPLSNAAWKLISIGCAFVKYRANNLPPSSKKRKKITEYEDESVQTREEKAFRNETLEFLAKDSIGLDWSEFFFDDRVGKKSKIGDLSSIR